jgi:hypothetical protein
MANLGKFRGLSATANTTFASGVFTLSRHYQQVKQNLWPFPIFGPIDYLIVGGGGAGGATNNTGTQDTYVIAGGGGGGQVKELFNQYLTSKGPFSVVVGTGGLSPAQSNITTPGGDSSFNGTTSTGGGSGAMTPDGSFSASAGPRGGGSVFYFGRSGLKSISFRSANGGSSAYGSTTTGSTVGGGGGAGGGSSATGNYIGGDGVNSVITGLLYGGGGNSCQVVNIPSSGWYGTMVYGTKTNFGAGGWDNSSGNSTISPRENSGGGGLGRFFGSNIAGQPGAAGVVVIRYLTGALSATGGTTSTSGIYTLHTFTTSGTFTVL